MREYIVNEGGERTRVVLSVEEYEELVEAREELAGITALNEDKALMDSGEAGFVPWEEVRDKTGSEYGSEYGFSSSRETPETSESS
jgi:hypothetical protein